MTSPDLFRLQTIDIEGGHRTTLLRSRSTIFDLAGSPDGQKVALSYEVPGGSSIGIVSVRTRALSLFTWGSYDTQPTWCADGKSIVFVRRGKLWMKRLRAAASAKDLNVRGGAPTCF